MGSKSKNSLLKSLGESVASNIKTHLLNGIEEEWVVRTKLPY